MVYFVVLGLGWSCVAVSSASPASPIDPGGRRAYNFSFDSVAIKP